MATCERIENCSFFKDRLANMPGTAEIFKHKYCQTDCSACARYMVLKARGKEAVPADLFPNHQDRAKELIGMH